MACKVCPLFYFTSKDADTLSLSLTTAMGSLLRVAARLNFLTCVLRSIALANSFRVGIGTFCKEEQYKLTVMCDSSECAAVDADERVCVYLDVVEVDFCEGGVVALYPLQGVLHIGGVRGLIEHRGHLLPFNDI